ncbi:unnamed protein product [marine sediment metagenome]|uniref:Right handed beta helix domain-containing protein n=1 Tax=marine sediment metagenome TaxID=412755 RepID=X0T5A1_9ZZZZ
MFANAHRITSHKVSAEEYHLNPIGNVYYVRNNGSDNNDGKSPNSSFLTLANAVDTASDWDKIILLASTDTTPYLEEADCPIEITQTGLKILGSLTSERQWGTPAIHSHGTDSLLYINAHQVEIANVAFHMQGAAPAMIEVAQNGNYWRTHIHDCYFGGNNLALCGVVMGNVTGSGYGHGSTVDAPCTVVEDCYFIYINGAAIYMNCGYGSVVRNCSFFMDTGDTGIVYGNNGTSRPHAEILNNRFATSDVSNAFGIKVPNTPSAGYFLVDGNQFLNFADDDHCCEKRTGYMGNNRQGVTDITVATD